VTQCGTLNEQPPVLLQWQAMAFPQEAHDFFEDFARAEQRLKAAGFHGADGPAQVDWQRFAAALEEGGGFAETTATSSVEYILARPPRKQVVRRGSLDWSNGEPGGSRLGRLVTFVCRIRNNLFHGAKFGGDGSGDRRDLELVFHGRVVLAALMKSLPAAARAGKPTSAKERSGETPG
jgi:hypothetical protein